MRKMTLGAVVLAMLAAAGPSFAHEVEPPEDGTHNVGALEVTVSEGKVTSVTNPNAKGGPLAPAPEE